MKRILFAVLAAAVCIGAGIFIGMQRTATPEHGSSSPSAPPPTAAAATTPAPAPALPALSDAQVQDFVVRWVKAQNDRDFVAYEKLYAQPMLGIKRSRGRTTRFDRAGWMADRKHMLEDERTLRVDVQDVSIARSATGIVVDLLQTFQLGGFRDQGPKRLVLARQAEGLRIQYEEMRRSLQVSELSAELRKHILPADGHYVLLRESADVAWGTGPFRSAAHYVTQATGSQLPGELAALRGRSVTLHFMGGSCTRRIVELELRRDFAGVIYSADGDALDTEQTQDPDFGRKLFASESAALVGKLDAPCSRALFAHWSDDDIGPIFAPMPTRAELAARAQALVEKSKRYAQLQQSYDVAMKRSDPGSLPHVWYEHAEATGYGSESHGLRYLMVHYWNEEDGCGDELAGELYALYEVDQAGELTLINDPMQATESMSPALLLDADHDGHPELIDGSSDDLSLRSLKMLIGGSFESIFKLSTAGFVCPC